MDTKIGHFFSHYRTRLERKLFLEMLKMAKGLMMPNVRAEEKSHWPKVYLATTLSPYMYESQE